VVSVYSLVIFSPGKLHALVCVIEAGLKISHLVR
jgi:hypothetical protein